MTLGVLDLSDEERERFAKVLLGYFPWIEVEDEEVSGAVTIAEILDLHFLLMNED